MQIENAAVAVVLVFYFYFILFFLLQTETEEQEQEFTDNNLQTEMERHKIRKWIKQKTYCRLINSSERVHF